MRNTKIIHATKLQGSHLTKAPRNCNLLPQELEEHKTLKNTFLMANNIVISNRVEKVLHKWFTFSQTVSPLVKLRRRQECKRVLNATHSPC